MVLKDCKNYSLRKFFGSSSVKKKHFVFVTGEKEESGGLLDIEIPLLFSMKFRTDT